MKYPVILAEGLILMLNVAILAQASPMNDPDRAKMDSITQRARNGEKRAILEEADIKPEISIPALSKTARDKSTDPEMAELARQALTRVKGVEDYLKQKIEEQSGKHTHDAVDERNKNMETLALVRTNKAIRTIASYLFDDKNPGYSAEDYGMPSNKFGAAITLDEMKLSGAPSTIFTTEDEHIAAWRTWWLKNQSKFDDASPYQGKQ